MATSVDVAWSDTARRRYAMLGSMPERRLPCGGEEAQASSSRGGTPTAGWTDPGQVEWYLGRIGRLEARQAGERALAAALPAAPRGVLDLGCGDGRVAALVLEHRRSVRSVLAVDSSPPMLARARQRFHADGRVEVREWDLRRPIRSLGRHDLVVSGFAIHHLEDERKQQLFSEIALQLQPGGRFANLEVVASDTARQHAEFLEAIGRAADDPEDRLAPVEDQLGWMRDAGMIGVECLWRWRGFALLVGEVPSGRGIS